MVPFLAAALQGGAEGARGAAIVRSLQRAANLAARADLTSRRQRWGPFRDLLLLLPVFLAHLSFHPSLCAWMYAPNHDRTMTFADCAAARAHPPLYARAWAQDQHTAGHIETLGHFFKKHWRLQYISDMRSPNQRSGMELLHEGFKMPHQQLAQSFWVASP